MFHSPQPSCLLLPADVERRLSSGADALVPRPRLPSLRRIYPKSRIEPLDHEALAGLEQVDLVVVEGPVEACAMRVIHLSLRPGGVLLWLAAVGQESLLREAGFVDARREGSAWTARRSAR